MEVLLVILIDLTFGTNFIKCTFFAFASAVSGQKVPNNTNYALCR